LHLFGGRTQCHLLMTFLPSSAKFTAPAGMCFFPIPPPPPPPSHSFDPYEQWTGLFCIYVTACTELSGKGEKWTRIRPGDMIAMF
jgi:hypothetical protein